MGVRLTNWNHTFIVVIQILLDNFKQCRNRPAILRFRAIFQAQKLVLNLHFRERTRQSPDHGFIGNLVDFDADHDAEVEHEFVALVFLVFDADGMAEDAVFVVGVTDCDVPVTECLSGNNVLGHGLEVEETGLVYAWLGDDASWRALVDNLCTCGMSVAFI